MSLGDDTTPSRPLGQSLSGPTAAAAAASNRAEQIPIRFFSNGFTVGDGELRKFEDNKEFMECIKRSEVPPELKNLTAGGRQIEVNEKISKNKLLLMINFSFRYVLKIIKVKNINQ